MFLKNGALFIADAHYTHERRALVSFLKEIIENPPPQIFLVGDIFHLMIGDYPFLATYNQELIDAINRLAQKSELYLFEGNHDFLLKGVFSLGATIVKKLELGEVVIAHGDLPSEDKGYSFYSNCIRNAYILKLLHFFSFNFLTHWIFRHFLRKDKEMCLPIENFEKIAQKRVTFYPDKKVVIEGHYHQNKMIVTDNIKYFNLPAFSCNNKYVILKLAQGNIEFDVKEYNEKR